MSAMDMASKLQLRPGSAVAVLGLPENVELEFAGQVQVAAEAATDCAILAFAIDGAALDTVAAPAIAAAREDRVAWIAYPKAGKLGTDLNRDILAAVAGMRGVQPVRQVAIDETWSALRFRPAI
jgi:hypothetical protein